jgi:hypothetical protein
MSLILIDTNIASFIFKGRGASQDGPTQKYVGLAEKG